MQKNELQIAKELIEKSCGETYQELSDGEYFSDSTLLSLLNDSDFELRLGALMLIDSQKTISLSEEARRLLYDEEDVVVVQAIETCVSLSDDKAINGFIELLDSEDNLIVSYAAWGIARLGDQRHLRKIQKMYLSADVDDFVKCSLLEPLCVFDYKSNFCDDLTSFLKSSDSLVRVRAIDIIVGLKKIMGKKTASRLLEKYLLKERDPVAVDAFNTALRDLKI